ncbi:hypothetical protein [Parasynechococcus sp.]|uniref:hypothetical protein n=1 Tax=Parasynechococcus sp. TaxID=3101203 RepID=UPI00370411ED
MVLIWWVPVLVGLATASVAQQAFQQLDVVSGWLIERQVDAKQQLRCRASLPSGGTWFTARIHLDSSGQVVVPEGLSFPTVQAESLDEVRAALDRCRDSILYLP